MTDILIKIEGSFCSGRGKCRDDFYNHFSKKYEIVHLSLPGLRQKFSEKRIEQVKPICLEDESRHILKGLGWQLKRLLKQKNGSQAIIVAHSKGALYAADCLTFFNRTVYKPLIKAVILAAPAPPKGISAVNLRTLWYFKSVIFSALWSASVKRSYRDTANGVLDPDWPETKKREFWGNLERERRRVILKVAFAPPDVDLTECCYPKLVIVGTKDRIIPPRLGLKVAIHHNAEIAEVNAAHHMLSHPETISEIDNFLEEIESLRKAA